LDVIVIGFVPFCLGDDLETGGSDRP